ncbi:MAG: hypothetical protein HYV65_00555 [Candidatus Spechtbacteria bacterium]|nr:hypothetical protein [Candidatus Spechtbacteria bacterium]
MNYFHEERDSGHSRDSYRANVKSRITNLLDNKFFKSAEYAAVFLVWPMLIYAFVHIIGGNPTSNDAAWRILNSWWNIGGIIIAAIVSLIILGIFLRGTEVSPTFEKISVRAMLALIVWTAAVPFFWEWVPSLSNTPLLRLAVIALISAGLMISAHWIASAFSPVWKMHARGWLFAVIAVALVSVLWQFIPTPEKAPPLIPESVSSWVSQLGKEQPRVTVATASPPVRPAYSPPATAPNASLSKYQPGFSGVENDGDITTVYLNGTEEQGLQAAMVQPGEKYEVRLKKNGGNISSFDPVTKKYNEESLHGILDGYVYKNASPKCPSVDWSSNFRYSKVEGIKPNATLVVLGIGSTNETVAQFADNKYIMSVQNSANIARSLSLYYHSATYYWLDQKDGVFFPSQELASCLGRPVVVWKNGWQDQGKTSQIFEIRKLQ